MTQPRMRKTRVGILLALLLGGAGPYSVRAGDAVAWLKDRPYRVSVTATAKADAYDVSVRHEGLAQPDGRDVRVIGPQGKPVSQYLAWADDDRFRVVFDAADGPGSYLVYFGNLSTNQPMAPDGLSLNGRSNWAPMGGFRCTSYDAGKEIAPRDLMTVAQVRQAFEEVRRQALEAEKTAPAATGSVARIPFVRQHVFRSTDAEIGGPIVREPKVTPPPPFHLFRAQITVANDDTYNFDFLPINNDRELVVVGALDGNWNTPLISGCFAMFNWGVIVGDRRGKAHLTAGRHVLEICTTRPALQLQWRRESSAAPAAFLNGSDADFDGALPLTPGAVETEGDRLGAAYVATIRAWLEQGSYAKARRLARLAQKMFPGDKQVLGDLGKLYELAEEKAYADNWLTEGRNAARTGASDATFLPPLKMQKPQPLPSYLHDNPHISSAAWVEGRLVYGLPFDVQKDPWAVTSGNCVFDDTVYVGTKNGVMHAVSLSTGMEKWNSPGEGCCRGTPLLYRNMLFFGALDGRLYALDVPSGRMLWNFPSQDWVEGSPCAGDGRVYFGSRDKHVYAVDAALGVERWQAELDGEILATPCLVGTNLYVGTRAGSFYALNAETGHTGWIYTAGAPIETGACAGQGRVCFGDLAGNVHCLDAATGKRTGAEAAQVGGPVRAAPILVGAMVYGGTSDGKLFGVNAADNRMTWHAETPSKMGLCRQPLFVNDKLIFVTVGGGQVLTFEHGTGEGAP